MIGRNNALIIAIIGTAVVSLAAVSYVFGSYSSAQVSQMAAKDVESSTQRQTHDLSNVLISKVETIDNNLGIIAKSSALQDTTNIDTAKMILSKSQESTSGITDFYMWLDKSGHMVWLSDLSSQNYQSYKNVDLSFRPYFTEAKATNSLYYSTAINSNDKIPRLYISEPVSDAAGGFNGVIVAAVRLDTLGKFLQSQITPSDQGSVGMLDRNGTVLYSDDLTAIGQNVFGDEFQKRIPEDLKAAGFNDFLHQSLAGGSGVQELTYRGVTGTYAYNTISVENRNLGVLYVSAAHALTGSVNSVIDQQRLVNTTLVIAIGGLALGIAFLVVSWNARLHATVRSKTQDLEKAVTSLEEANTRLEEHDKLQHEFINIAAHELRTPVQPLIGIAETMQEAISESPTRTIELSEEEVEMLARNAKRLQLLTENILDVTRIDSKTLRLDREMLDLNENIIAAINETLGTAGALVDNQFSVRYDANGGVGEPKRIMVSFRTSDRSIAVMADRTRLYQVISNILRNAIKFSNDGGVIEISATKSNDGTALVSIRDNGRGINREILSRLFTKFSSRSESGTGLGLYLSKAIVEAHGGKIWAENNADGGACFYFSIPQNLETGKKDLTRKAKQE